MNRLAAQLSVRLYPWRWVLPLCLLVVLVYAGTMSHGFHFDDDNTIVHNPSIRSPVQWQALWTDPGAFSRTPGAGMFRPLLLSTFAANYAWSGLQGWSWHLVNVLLHAAVSVLVVLLGRQLGCRPLPAAVAGVAFALHPVCVEPVSYISSRSELLATMFLLLGVLGHMRSRYRPAVRYGQAWSLAALAAGLLCKATVATAPLLIGAFELLVLRQRPMAALRRSLPAALLVLGYVAVVRGLLLEALLSAPVRGQLTQLLTQGKALVYYARLLILPHPLSVEQPFSEAHLQQAEPWLAALLVLSIGWLMYRHAGASQSMGGCRFLLLWPVLVLLPTIIVPLNVLVSEHRVYPVLAGLLPCAGLALPRRMWAGRLPVAALVVAMVLAASLSLQRTHVWASEATLWQDAARWSHGPRPLVRLALIDRAAGRLAPAAERLRQAIAVDPAYAPAWNNLGNVQRQGGDPVGAEQSYEVALELLPRYPEALTNLAALRVAQQRFEEARQLYDRALEIHPDHALMHNNLGTMLLRTSEFALAEQHLRRALSLGDANAAMWRNLGGALSGLGRPHEALEALRSGLAIDATYAPAWLDMGQLLAAEGRTREAHEAWREFLRTWRGNPDVAAQVRQRMQPRARQ